jgi:predicted transposase YdaD
MQLFLGVGDALARRGLTTSILPERISKAYSVKRLAQGCYRVQPAFFSFVWIAANELPLVDELVPFLVARSGNALAKFVRWVVRRRPVEWVLNMIQILPMSESLREEMRRYVPITDDPGVRARQEVVARYLLDILPELRREVREEGHEEGRENGRLQEARSLLRRILSRRKLSLTAEQDARIEACPEIETLERWLDQAIDAPSAEDALQ